MRGGADAVYIGTVIFVTYRILLGKFSWESDSPYSLRLLVNFSHMGLVPIGLKFIKRFRKGVWGTTLLQKGFPQLFRRL